MGTPRHPGHEFVQGYEPGLPTCRATLGQLVRAYADFLRDAAGQKGFPVDVASVADAFRLTVVDADLIRPLGIDGANIDALGLVLLSSDGPETRRRFTLAHELVEKLVAALRGNRLAPVVQSYLGDTGRKERLCHWGAAALLLPRDALHAVLAKMDLASSAPASLASASAVADQFGVSLFVAAQALAERYGQSRTALVVWRLANKPTELRSAAAENQTTLFGERSTALPPKAARVWWGVFPHHLRDIEASVRHSSSPAGSVVHTALTTGTSGTGQERVAIGKLDAVCDVDARRVLFGDEPVVVSLVRLPASYGSVVRPDMFRHGAAAS